MGHSEMETWLECEISSGQFEGERGVDGKQHDGTPFSFFAAADSVKSEKAPTNGKTVRGWVKVEVLQREGDLVLVRLPRQTFQGGPFVTVNASQLETPPPKKKQPSKKREPA